MKIITTYNPTLPEKVIQLSWYTVCRDMFIFMRIYFFMLVIPCFWAYIERPLLPG
jgi:hypothetical protein